MKKRIEVVIPCYNEKACVELVYKEIHKVAERMPDYRVAILFVDDGSKDGTLNEIKRIADLADEGEVNYISFSRNFGKEAAIYAGLRNTTADYVALMDADLQHPPYLLESMMQAIEDGYDCAGARRTNREGEPFLRSALSRWFYRLSNKIMSTTMEQGVTDYRLMTRQFVNAVLDLSEKNRFTKGIFSWVGYDVKWIEYENVERVAGDTKWSLRSLLGYAINGFMAFATSPLRGAVYLGIIAFVATVIYGLYIFVGALIGGGARNGYSSIMLTMLLLGSVIIMLLGVIGEYLARIYIEVKNRPIYIVKEKKVLKNTGDE